MIFNFKTSIDFSFNKNKVNTLFIVHSCKCRSKIPYTKFPTTKKSFILPLFVSAVEIRNTTLLILSGLQPNIARILLCCDCPLCPDKKKKTFHSD